MARTVSLILRGLSVNPYRFISTYGYILSMISHIEARRRASSRRGECSVTGVVLVRLLPIRLDKPKVDETAVDEIALQ